MGKIKKLVLYIYLLVALVGSVASGFYLIVNVSEIPEKLTKVHIKVPKPLVSPKNGEQKEPSIDDNEIKVKNVNKEEREGFKALLSKIPTYDFVKSISIDLSAITPFLMLLFFGMLSWNTIKYRRHTHGSVNEDIKKKRDTLQEKRDTLPLLAGYESTAIQLGFTGTLWGFLIIGYRMQGVSAGQSVDALDIILKAFGTALLSTFTAVVIVYILTPIFRGIWRWMFNVGEDDTNIGTQLDKLTKELQKTSKATGTLQDKIEPLFQQVQSLGEEMAKVSPNRVIELLESIAHDTRVTSEINNDLRVNHLNGLSAKVSSLETKIVTQGGQIISAHNSIIVELKNIEKSYRNFHEQSMVQAKRTENSLVNKLEGIQTELAQIAAELTKQEENKPEHIKKLTDKIEEIVKSISENSTKQIKLSEKSAIDKLDKIEKTLVQFSKDAMAQTKRTENAVIGTPVRFSNTATKRFDHPENTIQQTEKNRKFFSKIWGKFFK